MTIPATCWRSWTKGWREAGVIEGATKEEQQAFKHFARAQRPEWRADGWMFAGVGWTGVIAGALIGAGWSTFVLFLFISFPHAFRHPVDYEAPDISMIVAATLGLGLVLAGHYYLRVWWRIRSFRHLEPASAVGEVVAWMPYRDWYTPTDMQSISERETLIELRRTDSTTHIFRVPAKYAHRVRERGEVVRVYFRPATERVVTVQRLGQAWRPARD